MDAAPLWVLSAILRIETGTTIGPFGLNPGKIRRGAHGERGAMQIRRAAFDDVALPGESYDRMDHDHDLNVRIGNRYLLKLYKRFNNWDKTIMAYNAGASNLTAGREYLAKVKSVK